jgi:hypothetical protein
MVSSGAVRPGAKRSQSRCSQQARRQGFRTLCAQDRMKKAKRHRLILPFSIAVALNVILKSTLQAAPQDFRLHIARSKGILSHSFFI